MKQNIRFVFAKTGHRKRRGIRICSSFFAYSVGQWRVEEKGLQNNKMKARDAKQNPANVIFLAVFVMFVISGLLLLLLAMLLFKLELSEEMVKVGIVVIYVVSGLVGGLIMGKRMREQKFLWGLAAGSIYFALLLVMSLLFKGDIEFELSRVLTTAILCMASGMAGGMIS